MLIFNLLLINSEIVKSLNTNKTLSVDKTILKFQQPIDKKTIDLIEKEYITKYFKKEYSCRTIESKGKRGSMRKIKQSRHQHDTFWIKPLPSFEKLIFQLRVDNTLTIPGPFIIDNKLEVTKLDLDVPENYFIRVTVDSYREKISASPDYRSLKVSFKYNAKHMVTDYWWRQYTFDSIIVYIVGDAEVGFDCTPSLTPPTTLNPQIIDNFPIYDTSQQKPEEGTFDSNLFLIMMLGSLLVLTVLILVLVHFLYRRKMDKYVKEGIRISLSRVRIQLFI